METFYAGIAISQRSMKASQKKEKRVLVFLKPNQMIKRARNRPKMKMLKWPKKPLILNNSVNKAQGIGKKKTVLRSAAIARSSGIYSFHVQIRRSRPTAYCAAKTTTIRFPAMLSFVSDAISQVMKQERA